MAPSGEVDAALDQRTGRTLHADEALHEQLHASHGAVVESRGMGEHARLVRSAPEQRDRAEAMETIHGERASDDTDVMTVIGEVAIADERVGCEGYFGSS